MTFRSDGSTPPPAGTSLDEIAAGLGLSLGRSPAASQEPLIYLGMTKSSYNVNPSTGYVTGGTDEQAKTKTYGQMLAEFEKKSVAEQRRMAFMLALGGYVPGVTAEEANKWADQASVQETLAAYGNLLEDASSHYGAGHNLTPSQLLTRGIRYRVPTWDGKMSSLDSSLASAGIQTEEKSLAGTKTSTYKSFDFMDPMDAKALARGVLQQELGRDPTQAEYEDFISAIHAAEKRNPSINKVTTTTDDTGAVVSQTSSSSGGLSSAGLGQMAMEKAQRNPDWAEWQAMGTYAPALFEALGSAVPGT